MKKQFLFLFTFIQFTLSQNIGIQGGVNFSNFFEESNTTNYTDFYNYEYVIGFNLGLIADFTIDQNISIEGELRYDNKGFETNQKINGINYYQIFNFNYIDIVGTIKYRDYVDRFSYFGGIGPYIGIGLNGTGRFNFNDGTKSKIKIKWGDKADLYVYKRLDYGMVLNLGLGYKDLYFKFTYMFGLANISPNTSNGHYIQNRVISMSLIYNVLVIP